MKITEDLPVIEQLARSSEPAPDRLPMPRLQPPWPGYFKTKGGIERLTRFKNLVIHNQTWSPEMQPVLPLAELFPGEVLQEGTYSARQRVEREIRENLMVVVRYLHAAGIATQTKFIDRDSITNRGKTMHCDLVLDYFILSVRNSRHYAYEALMERLDMGIGVYKARLPSAKCDLFNPIAWLAYLIRLPMTILERAGLASHPKSQEILVGAYAWIIRITIAALIVVLLVHYGAKIPWEDAISGMIRALPK